MSMKVAVITRLTNPGGIPSCALSLIRGLNARNITPDLIWDLPPSTRLLEQWGASANHRVIPFRIPTLTVQKLPESLRYLAWILNAVDGKKALAGYDFVYTFNQVYMLEGLRHLYYVAGPPLIPVLDVPPPGIKALPLKLFKWLYRNWFRRKKPIYDYLPDCRLVICSQYTADLFQKAHGVSLPVIPPPIRMPDQPVDDDLSGRDTVLFFSRIVPYKRPDLMLEIASRRPELRWVVMGGNEDHQRPYLEWLQGEVGRRRLQIEFIVNPDEQTVRRELHESPVLLLPCSERTLRNGHPGSHPAWCHSACAQFGGTDRDCPGRTAAV